MNFEKLFQQIPKEDLEKLLAAEGMSLDDLKDGQNTVITDVTFGNDMAGKIMETLVKSGASEQAIGMTALILAETVELSYPGMLKFLKESTELFKKFGILETSKVAYSYDPKTGFERKQKLP